jgi:hypothetical protein
VLQLGGKRTVLLCLIRLSPTRIQELFSSQSAYKEFASDYKDLRDIYENLKHELAN